MRPAAFLFDLDGTLVATETYWTRAIVAWLADCGCTDTVENLLPLICGHSQPDIYSLIVKRHPSVADGSKPDYAKTIRAHYARLVTDPAQIVIPGSVAFLKKAARLAPCVIVSGSPHDDVAAAADLCGVGHLLKFVLGAEDYGRGKPAPDGFLEAAARLDVDASECVVVEDSSAGVAAGRAAGMRVLGLDRPDGVRQDFSGCEWLVRDLSELDVAAVFGNDER